MSINMDSRSDPGEHFEAEEVKTLKAETIYIILKKSFYVSRSLRIQWFLQHLNSKICVGQTDKLQNEDDSEVVVISIIPRNGPKNWSAENAHLYDYLVELSTNVIFLGEVYRQVYCLDISPSVSTVDIQQGEVLLDVIIKALQKSIQLLIKPFIIPGSSHLFSPNIFLTVIAHTPFYISPAQQVLVQGWKVSEDNVEEFLEAVLRQLEFIEDAVAQVSGTVHDQFERERKKSIVEQMELKKSTEALFDDDEFKFTPTSPNIAMVSPGSGFLNLLRFGMLALKLLPVSNFANLVVITDGMIIMPDIDTLDSVLNHMRYNDIACYFLHVGSQFHPHCGLGFVPYTEVMQLISVATNGAYMPFPPQNKQTNGLNVYQINFLTWGLTRKSIITDLSTPFPKDGDWTISNRHFYGNRSTQLIVKKYLENDINVTVYGVLACRIREGFILNDISARENELVINFVLPWTNHIYIEYTLTSQWPLVASSSISTHYVINIKAPYEFLHDISCRKRIPIKSPFRQSLIARFWRSLKSFAQSDLLLSHLESFMNNVSSYYLPEVLKNGMPLYYLTPGSCQPTVGSSDIGFSQFGTIWRPACLLNNNLWLKWFHADRVGVIFRHDEPLNLFPQNLQALNARCTGVQCRQATNTLYNFLKSYCSFVLIENHSYIKFLLPNESGTGKHSFFVIRSIFKPPYAVIHIAFLYNIPGRVRSNVLNDFKRAIYALRIPRISVQKDSYDIIFGSEKPNIIANTYGCQTNCCVLLDKPLEKILIRYEQMPKEFMTVVFPDGTQPLVKSTSTLSTSRGLITTLSRYLHHRRWIWKAGMKRGIFLPSSALAIVLSTLVKIRLQEGFYFAHFCSGICNMVLEVQMKRSKRDSDEGNGLNYDCHNEDDNEELHSCIIQYVLFSPKTFSSDKDSDSYNDGTSNKVVELVSECWIEPQHGVITNCPPTRNYMSNLQYHQLPDAVWSVDARCISALFTFDYLRLMCENSNIEAPESIQYLLTESTAPGYWPNVAPFADQRISQLPFAFSIPNLLCQCVHEMMQFNLFSIDLLEKYGDVNVESNKLLLESLYSHLSSTNSRELVFFGQDAQYFIKNFRKNFRCMEKHHDSTSGLSRPAESLQSLNSNPEDVLPTSHDWVRMTSWALGEKYDACKNSAPCGCEAKQSHQPVDRPNSFYSSTFDISSVSNIENPDWLKWKCYVKFTSKTLCLITVVPDSVDVIRRLFLDHKGLEHILSESVYYDMESRTDVEEVATPAVTANDSCSVYTSCSSNKDLEEPEETVDKAKEMSNFRLRASTWDPVRRGVDSQGNVDDRLRTNSLGARVRPLPQLRCKRSADFDSKEELMNREMHVGKFVPLILPLYICKCPLTDVIDYLIYNNNLSECAEKEHDASSLIADNYLDEQCQNVSDVFNKVFILSLFKCLHQGYSIPVIDIEQAFSKCETSVLNIDITDYLKVVCKHMKSYPDEEESESKDGRLASFSSSTTCHELRAIHKLIKRKFTSILTLDFKSITTKPEFYYFFSSWTKESKPSSVGMLSPGLIENSATAEIPEEQLPTAGSLLGMNAWGTCKESVNSEDNACTSLLSNMDSDSLNEASHASLMGDLNPLFLKLECNIHYENKTTKCPVTVIPTCICEVLNSRDKLSDWNVNDLRITMDFVCLTSPYSEVKQKQKSGLSECSTKTCFTEDFEKSNICDLCVDGVSFEEGRVPKQVALLPDYQYEALNSCIAQIKWLMKDEIVTFMLDTSPVTWETLKMVSDHIESSRNAGTCFIEKVPLSFVWGKETIGINSFLQDFDNIKIPNYRLKKEKNMYYLAKSGSEKLKASHKRDYGEHEYPPDASRIMRSSVCEESEYSFQVFSSDESIFENESVIGAPVGFARRDSFADTGQSTIHWILERQFSNSELPNFWLIITISGDYVTVYFHCRFLDIKRKEIEEYVLVREKVIGNIKYLCKMVNQKMLLDSLHDTRICNQLLVPDSQQDDPEDEPLEMGLENDSSTFTPGYFACDVVWETKFILHPRLKTSPLKGTVSRGIQALCAALGGFSVINRKNLFVYQDVNRNVFYLRLYESIHSSLRNPESEETSSGSFSRSSSFTSLSKKQFEEQLPFLLEESRSRNKSFSDASDTNLLKNEDFITLKVHGISEAGNDIKNDLVQVLQNRLDDAVLDVISLMLSRNSLCKLLSEDVHFIQKPNQHPNYVVQFTIPEWTMKFLYSFRYFIKQNIQTLATLPKYSDPRSSFHFQDYSVPEDSPKRISEHDIFLYSQSLAAGKGIACLAFIIVDIFNDTIECSDELDTCIKTAPFDIPTLDEIKLFANTCILTSEDSNDSFARVEFRIWKQGKINMELLQSKLSLAIRHALWELTMEKNLLLFPVFEPSSVNLFETYHSLMPGWMDFGVEMNVPSVRLWEISVPIRPNLSIILKELNSNLLPHDTSCFSFYKRSVAKQNRVFQPCLNFDNIMHTGDVCLVIGSNLSYMYEINETVRTVNFELSKLDKGLQRMPSLSQEETHAMISKRKFISITIANSKIQIRIYNWTKDKIESLTKHMTSLCEWLQARSHLLSSIVQQKMGIFHNLPIQRADLPKKILEMTTSDLDVLLKYPVAFHKQSNSALKLDSIGEAFRDVTLPKATREKLADKNPFVQNVNQLREIQKIDRKAQSKYLPQAWPQKTPSSGTVCISEELLDTFLLRGRLIHYCLTPLLFMPSWRVEASATRDHSLSLKTQMQVEETSPKTEDEEWHMAICFNFIKEYKQYLQSEMGFLPVKKTCESSVRRTDESDYRIKNSVHYMQKCSLGGVLLFELFFNEPFFNAKLYAMENSRLNAKASSLHPQISLSFLDECDRIKFQMHLHSFTYDYHLRCLHLFISDQQSLLKPGYHMVDFLEDFMKYYPKAPNYARSLVHTEVIVVDNVSILPTQLFSYLLSHGKNYKMEAFCMTSQYSCNEVAEENEYVLIRNKNTSAIYYKDSNDVEQKDDFDIIIIISHLRNGPDRTMKFQIYVLITSGRDLYPKVESEQKLGKFRTVSTSYDYSSSNEDEVDVKLSVCDDSSSSGGSVELKERIRKKVSSQIEIKQEFVNYLGYYSSHEVAMQNVMANEVDDAKQYIQWMVKEGTFDCETHLLWNKLLCSTPQSLNYQELQHLMSLAEVFDITEMDEQLKHILKQPISWLQSFLKALVTKLPESCHLFPSLNGNTQELLVLDPQFSNGFIMIILNLQKSTCTMKMVYKKGTYRKDDDGLQALFERIINTLCYHLWLDAF